MEELTRSSSESELLVRDATGTQLLTRALRLLFHLRERDCPVTPSELVEVIGTSKSNVYRLLHTLELSGFVMRSDRGHVMLGLRFLDLGGVLERRLERELYPIAFPVMRRLTLELGETSLLTMAAGSSAICVVSVESPRPIRLSYATGRIVPFYAGASGKVLLPWIPWRLRELVLREYERVTADQPERQTVASLREQIATIGAQGFCVTEDEVDPGTTAVAAPILRTVRSLVGALTIAGPSERLPRARLPEVIDRVRDAATEIGALSARAIRRSTP